MVMLCTQETNIAKCKSSEKAANGTWNALKEGKKERGLSECSKGRRRRNERKEKGETRVHADARPPERYRDAVQFVL